jgi:DNA-directed RNA polymerase specialized sigma24 family protein
VTALPPFERLLDQHANDVLGFLVASVGPSDAEDCFQETFIAALRGYPKLDDDRNLKGWLMTIAHRKAIDHHRRGKREKPVAEVPERPVHDGLPGGGGIWTAVASLPPKQRTAVALRFACDMPHSEIAAALGGSEDAARQSLHEGLKKLREVLT